MNLSRQEDAVELLPLVSVVTVVFNASQCIEETICSVLAQTYPNIEYIIVDGGSTDGTLELIHKYRSRISVFCTESDLAIGEF
jgi:glycosyltransferase involved in cell wall biosynthesis